MSLVYNIAVQIKAKKRRAGSAFAKEKGVEGGHMSNDNLILFPKKSTNTISMTNAEAKWMISGSLLVVLTLALGLNSALFSQNTSQQRSIAGETQSPALTRSIASINPIFKVSWEKKAFESLENTSARDLANVGEAPSVFDNFAFGTLEGNYSIRKVDGKIAEIQFADNSENHPKVLLERQKFLSQNLALFASGAQSVKQVHSENNDERLIERFQLKDAKGQDLGTVQVLLDSNQNLLSMTVQ